MPDLLNAVLADTSALQRAVSAATGIHEGTVDVANVDANPVPITNMTTGALARLRGYQRSSDAVRDWSMVLKIVQSPEHSSFFAELPSRLHERSLHDLAWSSEPHLYRSPNLLSLPDGLRLPRIYRVVEVDATRIAIFMEDVDHEPGAWHIDAYRRAARLLGRLSGRYPAGREPNALAARPRRLWVGFEALIRGRVIPALMDEHTWAHPLMSHARELSLRADLEQLAARAEAILARLDELPQALAHGDACPQNLLRCRDGSDTIVVIDWQFYGPAAIGYDVGQLLAGHADSGEIDVGSLPEIWEAIFDEYAAGLGDEGLDIARDDLRYGAIGTLVLRSAFTAVPVQLLRDGDGDDASSIVDRRCRYARFLCDLASELPQD